jgi:hypothetical protein
LRDVQGFITDMLKLMQIEIESSNMMANFEVSSFVREFVDNIKTVKGLKNLSSPILPLDIQMFFALFLKQNQQRITIIDVKAKSVPPPLSKPVVNPNLAAGGKKAANMAIGGVKPVVNNNNNALKLPVKPPTSAQVTNAP